MPDAISQNTVVLPRERTRNSDQVLFIFTVCVCVCVYVCRCVCFSLIFISSLFCHHFLPYFLALPCLALPCFALLCFAFLWIILIESYWMIRNLLSSSLSQFQCDTAVKTPNSHYHPIYTPLKFLKEITQIYIIYI